MRPYTLVAELTHRCPLGCFYCSNPQTMSKNELPAEVWAAILQQAEALGVLQVNFSGGEPLLREDLEQIVEAARKNDLYNNLITSGVPLTRERLKSLKSAGLSAVQLSFQDSDPNQAEIVSGGAFHHKKLQAAEWIKSEGLPLTINVVLHKKNIERTAEFITLAKDLGASRLELANTQYLGWALENRANLLPSQKQIEDARKIVKEARAELKGKMELLFVLPDYWADRPRACMGGWAKQFIIVAPDGDTLPCHGAVNLPITKPNAAVTPLETIWHSSELFQAYRGDDWMLEPCKSCPEKEKDFGGCRCQTYLLTRDARGADPACSKSPAHPKILEARSAVETTPKHRRLRTLA